MICWTNLSAAELNITTLLEAAGRQPDIDSSQLGTKAIEIQLEQAKAKLNPKLSAFGSYEQFKFANQSAAYASY